MKSDPFYEEVYGLWLAPDGKVTPVLGYQQHWLVRRDVLGFENDDDIEKAGYIRIVSGFGHDTSIQITRPPTKRQTLFLLKLLAYWEQQERYVVVEYDPKTENPQDPGWYVEYDDYKEARRRIRQLTGIGSQK